MKREVEAIQAAAHALGVEVVPLEVRRADDIAPAFAALDGRADALYVTADPLLSNNMITISALTLDARLPNMHSIREEVVSGGLLSYGASFPDMFRRAAELVDKFCVGRNLPTFRLSSRPSSISWSTSRPLRRSVSPFQISCSRWRTRSSNNEAYVADWPLTSFTALQKCGRYRINSGQTAPLGLTGSAALTSVILGRRYRGRNHTQERRPCIEFGETGGQPDRCER